MSRRQPLIPEIPAARPVKIATHGLTAQMCSPSIHEFWQQLADRGFGYTPGPVTSTRLT